MTWLLGAAGALIVLALVLHFAVPAKAMKVPAVVIGTLGGLVVGAVLGMAGSVWYGDQYHKMVYVDMYKPDPMPSAPGATKVGQGKEAAPKKKASGKAASKGGPGTKSMPSDYPGMDKSKEEPKAKEELKAAADEPAKTPDKQ